MIAVPVKTVITVGRIVAIAPILFPDVLFFLPPIPTRAKSVVRIHAIQCVLRQAKRVISGCKKIAWEIRQVEELKYGLLILTPAVELSYEAGPTTRMRGEAGEPDVCVINSKVASLNSHVQ